MNMMMMIIIINKRLYIKRLSSVQQEVFTHRHDRHQTSVSKARMCWSCFRQATPDSSGDVFRLCWCGQPPPSPTAVAEPAEPATEPAFFFFF
jgi:hypothetical protein